MRNTLHSIQGFVSSTIDSHQLTLGHFLAFLSRFNTSDKYLLKQLPTLDSTDFIRSLQNNGLATIERGQVVQLHPLLGFKFRNTIPPFTEATSPSDSFKEVYNFYTQKAELLHQSLKKEEHRHRLEVLQHIQIDLLNYQWFSFEGAKYASDFFHSFKCMTDYLFHTSNYEEIIHYCEQFNASFPYLQSGQVNLKFRLALLKTRRLWAHALHLSGKHQEAVGLHLESIRFNEQWKISQLDTKEFGRIHQNLGIIYRFLKEFNASKKHLGYAFSIFQSIEDEEGIISVQLNFGNLLLEQNQFAEALNIYHTIEGYFKQRDRKYTLAEIYQNKGLAHRRNKDYTRSEENYQAALSVYAAFNDLKGQAQIYQNLGVLRWDTKQYGSAIDFYKKALEIYIPINAYLQQAKVYLNLGVTYTAQSNPKDGLAYYKQALSIYNDLEEDLSVARTLFNIGVAQWRAGFPEKSEPPFLKAKTIFERFNDTSQLGKVLLNLGVLYNGWNKKEKSKENSLKALSILKEVSNYSSAAQAALNLGISYANASQFLESNLQFKEALELAKKANDNYRIAIICKNMGHNFLQLDQPQKAAAYTKVAHKALQAYPSGKQHKEVAQLAGRLYAILPDKTLQIIAES